MKQRDRQILLQAALDQPDLHQILQLGSVLGQEADILEIGSAPIMKYGMLPVEELRKQQPDLVVLADVKIMDAGARSAKVCFEAGADIVTVLGAAGDTTIREVISTAKRYGGHVMIDLIQVKNLAVRAEKLDGMGADWMCVHAASDTQGPEETENDVFAELEILQRVLKETGTAIAGGIDFDSALRLAEMKPDVVIAGKVITQGQEPASAARKLKKLLNPAGGTDSRSA